MGGFRVGFEAAGTTAPGGVCFVRVRPGITQPVPVRRAAAEIPALLPDLDRHRGPHPDAGPGHLPFGGQAEMGHCLLVMLGREVNPAACLRHPQLDAVMLEQRRHGRVLAAVERPLVLPTTIASHPRPGSASWATSAAASGRRPHATVRLCPASKNSATITPPADQRLRLLPLPRPRGHRILPVLGGHPPVKREPQPSSRRSPGPAAARFLRPRHQAACTRSQGSLPLHIAHRCHGGHLPR